MYGKSFKTCFKKALRDEYSMDFTVCATSHGFFLFLTAAVWVQNFVAPSRRAWIQKMAQCYGLAKNAGIFASAMIAEEEIQ